MLTKIEAWGEGLGLRIPATLLSAAHLGKDSTVELSLVSGQIIITPTNEPPITLETLLADVAPTNLHPEITM